MILAALVAVILISTSCAISPVRDRIYSRNLYPPSMTCPDKLPVKILIAIDCPHGICGYTCKPGRWDEYE
jgi:hypothetical protein